MFFSETESSALSDLYTFMLDRHTFYGTGLLPADQLSVSAKQIWLVGAALSCHNLSGVPYSFISQEGPSETKYK